MGQGALELNPYKSSLKKKKVIQDKRPAVFSLLQLFGRMRLQVTAEATMSCINDCLGCIRTRWCLHYRRNAVEQPQKVLREN